MPHWLDAGRVGGADPGRRLALVLHRSFARPRPQQALGGVSRVVQGLLYPSDVLAGAMIGAATATGVLQVMK